MPGRGRPPKLGPPPPRAEGSGSIVFQLRRMADAATAAAANAAAQQLQEEIAIAFPDAAAALAEEQPAKQPLLPQKRKREDDGADDQAADPALPAAEAVQAVPESRQPDSKRRRLLDLSDGSDDSTYESDGEGSSSGSDEDSSESGSEEEGQPRAARGKPKAVRNRSSFAVAKGASAAWETVQSWPFSKHIYGFMPASTPAAKAYAAEQLKRLHRCNCGTCGESLACKRGNVRRHFEPTSKTAPPQKCVDARAAGKKWEHQPTLRAVDAVAESELLGELQLQLCGIACSVGLSTSATALLFGKGQPFLRGICRLPNDGLGTRNTVAARQQECADLLRAQVRTQVAAAVQAGAPLTMIADESPLPTAFLDGSAVVVVLLSCALWEKPLPVDIVVLDTTASSTSLKPALELALTEGAGLTEEQVKDPSVLPYLAGDHAAYMQKTATDMGLYCTGDGPHAQDLIIKQIITNAGDAKRIIMLWRKVTYHHHSVVARELVKAFGLDSSILEAGLTRWNALVRILQYGSQDEVYARLQQLCLYLSTAGAGKNKAPVAAARGDADEQLEQDVLDVDPAGEDVRKMSKHAAAAECAKLMADPKNFVLMKLAATLVEPFRAAVQCLQSHSVEPGMLKKLDDGYYILEPFAGQDLQDQEKLEELQLRLEPYLGPLMEATSGAHTGELKLQVNPVWVTAESYYAGVELDDMTYALLPIKTTDYDAELQKVIKSSCAMGEAGAKQFNKYSTMSYNTLERKGIASLVDRSPSYEAFKQIVGQEGAMHGLPAGSKIKLWDQWKRLLDQKEKSKDEYARLETETALQYWRRVTGLLAAPELMQLMLLWMSPPVSSADAERAFSMMTFLSNNFRRNGMKEATFRATMQLMLHRGWLEQRTVQVLEKLQAAKKA